MTFMVNRYGFIVQHYSSFVVLIVKFNNKYFFKNLGMATWMQDAVHTLRSADFFTHFVTFIPSRPLLLL